MHIEFISKTQQGLTHREKRLIAIIFCFVIAMIGLIAYSIQLAFGLILPILYAALQLKNLYRHKDSLRSVCMSFDFFDDYCCWKMSNNQSLKTYEIKYSDLLDVIFQENRCTIIFVDENKQVCHSFFIPQKYLEQFRSIVSNVISN